MCGIAGWIGAMDDATTVAAGLGVALRHRGPDRLGQRQWNRAALVHTRLSIIDLSEAGAQPMCNGDGSVWVAFNGEIYNHADERRQLESRGHRFRGRSDTEVLPHLYQEFGAAFVTRLKGMFAWAMYEPAREALLLGRDRFGIKPLFYAADDRRLVFASEITALKGVPGVDLTPDPQALSDYLALFCIPAPLTFYRGIRALPPGHLLEARWVNGRVQTNVRPFHAWMIAPRADLTLDEAVDRADGLIQSAVGAQLESDVPLGALLSGGIDSSLVSAAAQAAIGSLHTYNVQFPDAGNDETEAARTVSGHIHSHHETLDLQAFRGTWDGVTGLLRHAGQPFADTSMFGVHAVSRLMRQRVTTALSGDGGDEGFGGYPLYGQLEDVIRIQALPKGLIRLGATLLAPPARVGALPMQVPSRLRLLADADAVGVVQAFRSWVRVDEHARLSRVRHVDPVRRWFEPHWLHDLPRRASALERLSALATEVDARLLLPNDMLFKVDMASMKESLEVRVPLLDEDLFAFGLTLPHALKSRSRVGKRVLRGVARRRLPEQIAAKRKHGFTVPVDLWVTEDFKAQLRRTLLQQRTSLPEVVDPAVYRPWVTAFCEGGRLPGITREGLYQRTIMLLALHLALDP
jgi:asparagine synthase (glutamine-hydrolysing)